MACDLLITPKRTVRIAALLLILNVGIAGWLRLDASGSVAWGQAPPSASRQIQVATFMHAVGADDTQQVTAMLASDPSLAKASNAEEVTPLHQARSIAMATILLNSGADLKARDSHSDTPLRYAASRLVGDHERATALIRFLQSKGAKETDIYFATATGDVVQIKDDLDFDPTAVDEPTDDDDVLFGGNAPLQIAAYVGQLASAKCLLDHGADVHNRTGWNATEPLEKAAWTGHADVAAVLLDAGAKANGTDSDFTHSPLYNAATMGHADVVKLLLAHGATVPPTLAKSVNEAMQKPHKNQPNPGANQQFQEVLAMLNAAATQPAK